MCSVCTNRHQLLDFCKRKTQTLHSLNKSQALNVIRRIEPKPACAAEGCWQKLAALIKSDRVDTQSGTSGNFADLKCRLHSVLNARHDPSIQSGVWSRVKDVWAISSLLVSGPIACDTLFGQPE